MEKTTTKTAKTTQIRCKSAADVPPVRYTFAPLLQKFRQNLNKNVANLPQTWLPIETSLLIRYEFAALSPQTRYIFLAILLYCAACGTDKIPMDIRFLANALAVDERMLKNSLEELEFSKLLLERKKEREEKKHPEQTDETVVVVGDFQSFSGTKTTAENETKNGGQIEVPAAAKGHRSRFTIEECLRYARQSDGVKNPNALANNLFQTGNADAFIMAMLYPAQAEAEDQKKYGQPVGFTGEPCSVCFGARMADPDGKGYRACVRCKNERGKSTGFEPAKENQRDEKS